MQDVRKLYSSSAVDESMAVKKKLDHVGTSPLASYMQWTDGILQAAQQSDQSFTAHRVSERTRRGEPGKLINEEQDSVSHSLWMERPNVCGCLKCHS